MPCVLGLMPAENGGFDATNGGAATLPTSTSPPGPRIEILPPCCVCTVEPRMSNWAGRDQLVGTVLTAVERVRGVAERMREQRFDRPDNPAENCW